MILGSNILYRILNFSTFLYIGSILTLSSIAQLSSLTLLSSIVSFMILIVLFFKNKRIIISKFVLLPIILMIYILSSVLWATKPELALLNAASYVSLIFGSIVFLLSLLNGVQKKTIILALVISSLVLVISTVIEYMNNSDQTRFGGLLVNPNSLAIAITIISISLLYYGKGKLRLTYSFSLLVFVTYFSGSRKILFSWITIFIISSFLTILRKKSLKSILKIYSTFTIVLVFILILAPTILQKLEELMVFKRYEKLVQGNDISSGNIRLNLIDQAKDVWANNPFFGVGVGQFSTFANGMYAHNNYLELLASLGLIGLILYYSIYIWIIQKATTVKGIEKKVFFISTVFLLVVWDIALVSYVDKKIWLFIILMIWGLVDQEKDSDIKINRPY